MTRATIEIREGMIEVQVHGHADTAEACCEVSTLCCAVLNALGDEAVDVLYLPGQVEFDALATRANLAKVQVLYAGLLAASEAHPDGVGVTWVDDRVVECK